MLTTKPNNRISSVDESGNGLTKREFFAAMAMQGILADLSLEAKDVSRLSVVHADALIEALNKPA